MLDFIGANLHRPLVVSEVADLINLSPDRTRHFFKEQVGVPFSQYVLWKRMKGVIQAVVTRRLNMNRAAFEYGFANQSHFSRIFRHMFGAMPTLVLKNKPALPFVLPAPANQFVSDWPGQVIPNSPAR